MTIVLLFLLPLGTVFSCGSFPIGSRRVDASVSLTGIAVQPGRALKCYSCKNFIPQQTSSFRFVGIDSAAYDLNCYTAPSNPVDCSGNCITIIQKDHVPSLGIKSVIRACDSRLLKTQVPPAANVNECQRSTVTTQREVIDFELHTCSTEICNSKPLQQTLCTRPTGSQHDCYVCRPGEDCSMEKSCKAEWCYKAEVSIAGEKKQYRDCQQVNILRKSTCVETQDGVQCVCDGHWCNSASGVAAATLLLFISLLFHFNVCQ